MWNKEHHLQSWSENLKSLIKEVVIAILNYEVLLQKNHRKVIDKIFYQLLTISIIILIVEILALKKILNKIET